MTLLTLLVLVTAATTAASAGWSFSPRRSPRSQLTARLGAIGAVIATIAALAVVGPGARIPLPGAVRVCLVGWVTEGSLSPAAAGWSRALAFVALAVLAVIGGRDALRRARFTRGHRAALAAVAGDDGSGVWSVDHPVPSVYCLGGSRGVIVATTAATRRLSADELDVVLAHERAHQRGHHGVVRMLVEAVATAWPWLPAARVARRDVPVLLECLADDAATRSGPPLTLARAICRLAAAHPRQAMGAAGHEISRVTRLCARDPSSTDSPPAPARLRVGAWTALTATTGSIVLLAALTACSS